MPSNSRDRPGERAGRQRAKRYDKTAAQEVVLKNLQDGLTVKAALEKAGRSIKTWELWRKDDPEFRRRSDQARALRGKRDVVRGERLGFAEFRSKYLKTETFWHQLQWVDLLEGNPPRDLHQAQTYQPAKRNRLLVNTPPFHAKSSTLTVDYTVYRLCMDPGFRVLIISAGSTLAKDFLFAIKERLTSPDFLEMQKAYAPEGGWEATAESWSESRIVFGMDHRDGHEKDPNVQAVGMRSKIYGKRADLIIVDDGVDETNVNEYEKQIKWLRRTVESRLEAAGKMLVIGTRVAPVDLYSELLNPDNYANGKTPWTYMSSPAILEEGESPERHVTLWPYSDQAWLSPEDRDAGDECLCEDPACADGVVIDGRHLFRRWDGIHLERGPRAANSETDWQLIYQQQSLSLDMTFPEYAVKKATSSRRLPGILQADKLGHPPQGMHRMYVIAGCDPSIKGFAGLVVIAVDRETQKRRVMQAINLRAPTKRALEEEMKRTTEHYGVHEWRVEKTGLLAFFTQDLAFRQWFSTRGVRFTEHNTGRNKFDPAFGVSSIATLFGAYDRATDQHGKIASDLRCIQEPLIELPRPTSDGIKALNHQLIIWTPDSDPNKIPQDLVMALWFAEIGAREHLGHGVNSRGTKKFHQTNRFVSPAARARQQIINLADYRLA